VGEIVATRSELRQGLVRVPLDERTKIIVVPDAVEREIVGMLFDSGRAFLWLDAAVEGLREAHRLAVRTASGKDVLVVVHTEPQSDVSRSEKLSSDRAAVVAAWLEGDVDKWVSQFDDSVPKKERWGAREDQHMLRALGDFDAVGEEERPEKADPRYDALVRGFQRSRGLKDDGIAGPVTRKQLVKEYFALAQVTEEFEPVPSRLRLRRRTIQYDSVSRGVCAKRQAPRGGRPEERASQARRRISIDPWRRRAGAPFR
jgi:hypothetical protein